MIKNIKKAAKLSSSNIVEAKNLLQPFLYRFPNEVINLKHQMLDEMTQLVEQWPQNDLQYLLDSFENLYRQEQNNAANRSKKNQDKIEQLMGKLSVIIASLYKRAEEYHEAIHYYSNALTWIKTGEEANKLWESVARTATKALDLDVELPSWSKYKEQLHTVRSEAFNSQNPQEIMKNGFLSLVKNMIEEAIGILGEAPTPFAIVESGPLTEGDVLPYSKLELRIVFYVRLTENNSKYFKKLLDILKFQAISMGEDDTVVHYVNPGFQITHNIYSNPVVGLSCGVFTYSRENLGYNANIDAGVFIYGSQSLYNWVCEQLYPEQHRDVYHEQVSNHQRKIEALCKINPESIYVTYNAEKHEQESIFIGEGFNAEFMLKQTVELVNNFSKFYGIVGNDPIDKINLLAEQNIISLDVKETLTNLVACGIKLAYLAQKHYGYHTHNQNNNVFFKDAPAENRFVIPKQEYKQLKKTLDKVDALKAFVLQFKHDEESAIEAVKDKISNAQNQIQLTSIMDELTAGYRAKDREIESAQKVILDAMTDRSIAMNAIRTKVTIAQNHTTLNTLMDELVALADEMKNEIHKAQNHLTLTTLTTRVAEIDKTLSQSTSHLKHMIIVGQIPKDRVDEVLNFLFSRPSYTLKESPPVEIVLDLICRNLVSNEKIDEVLDFFFTIINNDYNIKNFVAALNGISHLLHMKKDIITHRIDEILNLLIKSYDNNENDANNKDYLLKIMTELVSTNQVSYELWDEAWNRLYSNAQKNNKDYDFVYTIKRLFEKGESLRGLKKELSEEQKLGVIDLFISKSQNSATDEINHRQFDKYFQILLHWTKENLIPIQRADAIFSLFMSNLILKSGISETHSYHKYDLIKGIKALNQNGLISEDKITELRNALYNQVDWEWDDIEALLPQNISYEVRYINKIIYDVENIINQDDILFETNKIGGIEAIAKLIELSKDKDIAEQILSAVGEYGAKKVLEILFGGKVKIDEKEVIKDNEPYNVSIKPKDAPILEAITKIEAFIGKENLSQIIGFYQYVSAALSNNALSVPATKVIQIMSNLVNNLEEWLDFGSLYERIDIDNQVTVILTQLENWFDFVASGHMHIGLPPRYSDFDPDYDFGGGSNGGDNGKHNNSTDINNIDFSLLFIGLNLTNSEIDH